MTIISRISVDSSFILTRASGILTQEEFLDYQNELSSDPDFRPFYNQLFDAREAGLGNLTSSFLKQLKMLFEPDVKRSILVTSAISFGGLACLSRLNLRSILVSFTYPGI